MSINYKKEIIIDRRSTKPLSEQIASQLERLLSSARVLNKQPMISVVQLARILKIPEKDVKQAYDVLRKDHFIMMDKNNIPYVSKYYRILDFFNKLVFIEDGIEAMGKRPSIEVLDFGIVGLKESAVIPLEKYEDKRFLKQVRLFKADGEPYIYLEEYYPLEKFPKLTNVGIDLAGNVYQGYLAKHYDIVFKKNYRSVHVHVYNDKIGKILKVKKDLPGFNVNMVYYDQYDQAFGYSQTYALPHFYFEYDNQLK
ncbi:MAG TPA: GntR family transcriptional regulator [Candidatus Izemoplasmatales bacterium]|nr:GntR family transcriptional regulator [Candidatus Izemoplasmatales bacterium]